mgnify:FL=1
MDLIKKLNNLFNNLKIGSELLTIQGIKSESTSKRVRNLMSLGVLNIFI